MKIKFLSSKDYTEKGRNYGDCIIIDDNGYCVIYDCGSEEHAQRVLKYVDERGIKKFDIVLSHNDSDHFNGIPTLLETGRVNNVYTLLVLKYVDEIMEKIDDGRKTRESIKRQIIETYDNIYQLANYDCKLVDAIDIQKICEHVKCVGPSKDYFIEATAKLLNSQESDQIDSETICNATSIQLEVSIDQKKLLLTGDSNFTAIEDKLFQYDLVQLPHHGKQQQAEEIFNKNQGKNHIKYYISDNTGISNGGSDNLKTIGHNVKNTKYDNDIVVDNSNVSTAASGFYSI